MTPLLAALSLLRQTPAPPQDPRVFLFDGEGVTLTMPVASTDTLPSNAVASWAGWSSLSGGNPTFPTSFRGAGDWSGIEKAYLDNAKKPAVEWRLKIVILANVDTLLHCKDGTWVDRRNSLTGDRFMQTLNAIPQFIALVSATTGGKLRILPDVTIDPEPSRDTVEAGKVDFDSAYLTHYLESRINGGTYQADAANGTKYRGPYDSVLFIDPCDHTSVHRAVGAERVLPETFSIDNTPAAEVSFDGFGGGESSDGMVVALFDGWTATASARATSEALPPITDNPQSIDWAAIADLKETPTPALLARLATLKHPPPAFLNLPPETSQKTFKTSNIKLSIVKDPMKGDVLQYEESHLSRHGGVALAGVAIDASKTPTLTITYKTSSDQPVALTFLSGEMEGSVSLGRDPERVEGLNSCDMSMPAEADGMWHAVSIDLKGLNLHGLYTIGLGPSSSAGVLTPDLPTSVSYQFAEFRLGNDPPTPPLAAPTPDATSPDPACRSLAAIEEAKKGQPSPVLAKLLTDPDNTVVLNALAGYASIADPFAEPKLIELSKSPSPRIAEFALKALAHQNSTAANAAIEGALKYGFEYNREIAAGIIAARHDPKSAQELVVLIAGQHWHTRLEAAESLAQVPGQSSDMMRLAILDQDDPVIKLAVIEHTDPQNEGDMRKMLWEAVNEPSDAVRAAACEKLIQSTLPDMRIQGQKGVRDDSWWTRVLILRYLREHPIEAARGAVKLALQDNSPRVRAEALLALSAFEPVTTDEVQGCLADEDPRVEKALIVLVKKHKLTLPDSTLEIFKKSPDPAVETSWLAQG